MSRIGKRIEEERMKKGMTPKHLGKKCGVAESFILDIESGRKIINEKLLSQISKALGSNLDERFVLEASLEEKKPQEAIQNKVQNPMETNAIKRSEVKPLAQWGEAFANIIKRIPIYDMKMENIKGYKSFPIIDNKVEGFHPDKLIYIEVSEDSLNQYRIKKGDRCLIYLNHELMNGTFQLLAFDGKNHLRKVKKVHSNRVQLLKGIQDDQAVIKDIKEIKILGRVIRVEIDL